jgi:hypothetical protein
MHSDFHLKANLSKKVRVKKKMQLRINSKLHFYTIYSQLG